MVVFITFSIICRGCLDASIIVDKEESFSYYTFLQNGRERLTDEILSS